MLSLEIHCLFKITQTTTCSSLYINPYISLNLFQVACDSLADTVFNTVWTLGCRPFMNSQRAACVCAEEEKEEL